MRQRAAPDDVRDHGGCNNKCVGNKEVKITKRAAYAALFFGSLFCDGGDFYKFRIRQLFLCEYFFELFRDYGGVILVVKNEDIAAVPFGTVKSEAFKVHSYISETFAHGTMRAFFTVYIQCVTAGAFYFHIIVFDIGFILGGAVPFTPFRAVHGNEFAV